jgi:hypothetical protein
MVTPIAARMTWRIPVAWSIIAGGQRGLPVKAQALQPLNSRRCVVPARSQVRCVEP